MDHAPVIALNVELGLATVRGLHSIHPDQVCVVIQAVAALSVPWQVECHDDYDGYLSIIVSSDDGDGPTFAITGKADQIELCEVRDDMLRARGDFGTIDAAAGALGNLLRAVGL